MYELFRYYSMSSVYIRIIHEFKIWEQEKSEHVRLLSQ